MSHCVSVEGSVVHVCMVFDGKWSWVSQVSDVYIIRSSGVLFVLFEIANCAWVVVRNISLDGKKFFFLIVLSMCLFILSIIDLITYVLRCSSVPPAFTHISIFFYITVCVYYKIYVCAFGKINIINIIIDVCELFIKSHCFVLVR